MERLLFLKIMTGRRRDLIRTCLYMFPVFLILMTFIVYLLVIYDNEVAEYDAFGFDYLVTDLDDQSVREMTEAGADAVSVARLIGSPVRCRSIETDLDIYAVPEWDGDGLTFWSGARRVSGRIQTISEHAMVMDVMTARTLGTGLGETVQIRIGEEWVPYQVQMLVRPEFCLNFGIVVILDNEYFRSRWMSAFDELPDLSVGFASGTSEAFGRWMQTEYTGPVMRELPDPEGEESTGIWRSVLSKEDARSEAVREMLYTPPAVTLICVMGMILLAFIIRREVRRARQSKGPDLMTLRILGMDTARQQYGFCAYDTVLLTMLLILAALTVKLAVYDRYVPTYYLPWELLLKVTAAAAVLTWIMVAVSVPSGKASGRPDTTSSGSAGSRSPGRAADRTPGTPPAVPASDGRLS